MKKFITLFACIIFLSSFNSEAADNRPVAQQNNQFQMGKNQQIQGIKPKKPVRIKLHRNANGEYTWDITGDGPDDVYRADSRLRKLLKLEK